MFWDVWDVWDVLGCVGMFGSQRFGGSGFGIWGLGFLGEHCGCGERARTPNPRSPESHYEEATDISKTERLTHPA